VVVLFHFEQFCGVFVVGSWSSACGFLSLSAAPSSLSFALQALLVFSYTFFPSLTETLYDSTRILCLQNSKDSPNGTNILYVSLAFRLYVLQAWI